MTRLIKYVIFPVVVLLFAVSCGRDDDTGTYPDLQDNHPISFELTYAGATATRVSTSTDGNYTTQWTEGDEVGLYVVKGSAGLQPSGNWADNIRMTYSGGSWTISTPVYYPMDREPLSFYAYYPYDPAMTDPTNFTFEVNAAQSAASDLSRSDLLLARRENVSRSGNPVTLAFTHALAMVELIATGSQFAEMSEEVAVTLEGCRTGVAVNLSSLTTTLSGNAASVKMYRVEQPGDANYDSRYTYRAVIPAQDINAGSELFRFSQTQGSVSQTLTHKPTAGVTFSAAELKPYTITLQPAIDPNHVYAVGDYYPYNGFPILGVVYEVSNGGKNGKIVDLNYIKRYAPVPGNAMAPIRWGDPTVDEQAAGVTGIRDMDDGETGTRNLIAKRKDQANFADTYCLFNWVYLTKNKGDINGIWYLPAVNELKAIQSHKSILNAVILAAGGVEIMTGNLYRALTEENGSLSFIVDKNGTHGTYNKSEASWGLLAIAVGKF